MQLSMLDVESGICWLPVAVGIQIQLTIESDVHWWMWYTDTVQSSVECWVIICWLLLLPVIHKYSPSLSQDMLTPTTAWYTQIRSSIESDMSWLPLLLDIHRYNPALSQGYVDFHYCLSYTHKVQHWVRDMLSSTAAWYTHIQSSMESGICLLPLLPDILRYSPVLSQACLDFYCCLSVSYTDTVQHWVRHGLTSTIACHTQIQCNVESGYVDFHCCLIYIDTVQ